MNDNNEQYPDKAFFDEAGRLCKSHSLLLNYLKTLEPISKSRNCVNSDEYQGEICGVHVFIKTFAHRLLPIRHFYGGHCINNEYNANSEIRKKGLARVATPYIRPRKDTAIFQYIPNTGQLENPNHHRNFTVPPRAFFQELIDSIRKMHENGICHGDIRRANILIGKDMHPWLVDTASTFILRKNPNFMQRYIFKCMKQSDLFSLAKIVLSYYPDWQDPELKKNYEQQPFFLKVARCIRHYLYALLRHKKRKTLKIK